MKLEPTKTHRSFEGQTQFWKHDSRETKTKMAFSTFIPEGKVRGCLIWLSGLTCNEENFIAKAGAQKALVQHQMMVICPDTSPRGLQLPHEHEADDFGSGAGFYVDAATPGYADHYRMYSYVTKELPELLQSEFHVSMNRLTISGHSMGGHGALVIGLREPAKFKAVSAFSPIANPMAAPWGKKAFKGYLGHDEATWRAYDATQLILDGHRHASPLLIDQGTKDSFLEKQLLTSHLVEAARANGQETKVRFQEGYDHSYYFISTFIDSHVAFHAASLD